MNSLIKLCSFIKINTFTSNCMNIFILNGKLQKKFVHINTNYKILPLYIIFCKYIFTQLKVLIFYKFYNFIFHSKLCNFDTYYLYNFTYYFLQYK